MTQTTRTSPSITPYQPPLDVAAPTKSSPPTGDPRALEPALSPAETQLVDKARKRTAPETFDSTPPTHSLEWYTDKTLSEAGCLLPGDLAFRAAQFKMDDGGLAERMLDHFVSGKADPIEFDLNPEFERNPQLREYVTSRIEFDLAVRAKSGEPVEDMTGSVWVPQSAYGDSSAGEDQSLALGGTYFEYQIVGSSQSGDLTAQISVSDHYFWSPDDTTRPTHCLHERGKELVHAGVATEFYQLGHGTLSVNNPNRAQSSLPLEIPEDEEL